MNKLELLTELDDYFATREDPGAPKWTIGDINSYQLKGAIVRENDRAELHDVQFFVYKEGQGANEKAYYNGDPINFFWQLKLIDHITITNEWSGRVLFNQKPKAICRIIQDPAIGEKWVLIEETAPDVWAAPVEIIGEIITDL